CPRRRPPAGTAAVVRATPAYSALGPADGRTGQRPARRRGPNARRADGGRVGRRRAGSPNRAVRAPTAGADVRGQPGQQPVVRAADGGGGTKPGLLRGQAARVCGRRAGVQLVDPAGLLPGLRADRGPVARGLLPVQGGTRRRGGGGALAVVPALAAPVLAGPSA